MRFKRSALFTLAVAPLLASSSARALTFIFDGNNVPSNVMAGFQAAADRWSANLTNNMNVRITVGWTSLDPGVLGSTFPFASNVNAGNFMNALSSKATSADDLSAVNSLPSGSAVSMLINHTLQHPNSTPYLDNNSGVNNLVLRVNMANQRAVGLVGNGPTSDGSITFSSSMNWDFDPHDGITPGALDFVGIATHEIGHLLGFGSGVDYLDQNPDKFSEDQLSRVTALDLFRYSADSAAQHAIDFTADNRDKYFSIDGGTTKIASFSTGQTLGDGFQASHWKHQTPALGILDPAAGFNQLLQISELDRRAFDIIGYTRNMSWSWGWAAGGDWGNALNWNADGVPTAAIDAVFNLNGGTTAVAPYVVSISSAANARSIRITSDDVTFDLGAQAVNVASTVAVGDVAGKTGSWTLAGATGSVTAQDLHVGGSSAGAGGSGTVNINVGATLNVAGNVKIWNAASTLNIAGGSMTAGNIDNAGTFNHTSGDLAISGTFTNTGTANFGPGHSFAPGAQLIANAGAAMFNAPSGSVANRPLAITINSGARVRFNTPQNIAALAVNEGGLAEVALGRTNTLVTSGLSLVGSGTLDLGDNDMVIFYQGQSPLRQVQQYALDGKDGAGLVASAAADASFSQFGRLLAVFDNANAKLASFSGIALHDTSGDFNQVLVKYTYIGDANLDGIVSPRDYAILDGNVGLGSDWATGDLNGDGQVTPADYALIDGNIGAGSGGNGGPPLGSVQPLLMHLAATGSDGASINSILVPEPGTLWFLGLGLLPLLRRRRR